MFLPVWRRRVDLPQYIVADAEFGIARRKFVEIQNLRQDIDILLPGQAAGSAVCGMVSLIFLKRSAAV